MSIDYMFNLKYRLGFDDLVWGFNCILGNIYKYIYIVSSNHNFLDLKYEQFSKNMYDIYIYVYSKLVIYRKKNIFNT